VAARERIGSEAERRGRIERVAVKEGAGIGERHPPDIWGEARIANSIAGGRDASAPQHIVIPAKAGSIMPRGLEPRGGCCPSIPDQVRDDAGSFYAASPRSAGLPIST